MSAQFYLFHYWAVILLMMTGLYVVIASGNIIKKVAGLSIFQTSVFLLFIAMGKVEGGTIPIFQEGLTLYSNPLPQVIVLTAIVVAVATMALGLAIAVRIFDAYGSLEEDSINKAEQREEHTPQGNDADVCDLPPTSGEREPK
ncbi:cation:proton antiporter subunit C [Dasania marina]|uniref:cation:proton antiporter subunit C n=1 Tax=Dasania marina TaxID=471499 RepID=UPI000379C3C3|nr:cation:proton antiporter subunit C [Dasania marina]